MLSGQRVPKNQIRIEAYGTVDELISFCGLLRDTYENEYYQSLIAEIQDRLMTIASVLSSDERIENGTLPQIYEGDISKLENEIDKMDEILPPLRSFILPGGNTAVSFCHITRTVCRRAERIIAKLSEEAELNPLIIIYLNRLSDFLFTLSRLISRDLNTKEIKWQPKL